MKRVVLLVLCLCLLLCGCGTEPEETTAATETSETTVQAESTEFEADNSGNIEASPELLIALYEQNYKQIFSYVKVDVSDSSVTVNVGNDGLGAAASSGLVDSKTWEDFKTQLVDLNSDIFESTKNLLGGRTLGLNFVDERDPSTSFLTIENSEVIYDYFAEDESAKSSVTSPTESAEHVSAASVASLIESALAKSSLNYDISFDETGITVSMWSTGVSLGAAFVKAGVETAIKDWNTITESTKDMCGNFQDIADACGRSDLSICVNILDDQNRDNILMMVLNGDVVYDTTK